MSDKNFTNWAVRVDEALQGLDLYGPEALPAVKKVLQEADIPADLVPQLAQVCLELQRVFSFNEVKPLPKIVTGRVLEKSDSAQANYVEVTHEYAESRFSLQLDYRKSYVILGVQVFAAELKCGNHWVMGALLN